MNGAASKGMLTEFSSMTRLCAQGDILIERVDDAPLSGKAIQSVGAGAATIAKGEERAQ
jgi:hypothetical protein